MEWLYWDRETKCTGYSGTECTGFTGTVKQSVLVILGQRDKVHWLYWDRETRCTGYTGTECTGYTGTERQGALVIVGQSCCIRAHCSKTAMLLAAR